MHSIVSLRLFAIGTTGEDPQVDITGGEARMQCLEERPQDWLAQARSFDIDQWLQERQVEHEENQDPDEPFPPRRPWPVDTLPMTALHVPNQLLNPGRQPIGGPVGERRIRPAPTIVNQLADRFAP